MDPIIEQMAQSKVVSRGEHIRAGRGQFLIRKCLDLKQAQNGRTFVAELQVVKSESVGYSDPKTKQPVLANAPGAVCSYTQPIGTKPQVALPNVKAFLCATLGVNTETISTPDFGQAYEGATGKAQMASGMLVNYTTRPHMTKKGEEITVVNFFHVSEKDGNSPEEISARRAALGEL